MTQVKLQNYIYNIISQEKMSSKAEAEMVTVRWDMPGSRYDGVVHNVSVSLVDDVREGNMVEWWPWCS